MVRVVARRLAFLSQSAQDFIEEPAASTTTARTRRKFLSQSAQDFIEDSQHRVELAAIGIPEPISSGLH